MAIILFGGSFNPVHLGHVAMAKAALKYLPCANFIWMPAACSPFKTNQNLAEEHHRFAMCELVADEDPRMTVSNLEFTLEKPSYTIHTDEDKVYMTIEYNSSTRKLAPGKAVKLPTYTWTAK